VSDLSPREFLRGVHFDPTSIDPSQRRFMMNGLFISHSGIDTSRIRRLISPITQPRFVPDGAFLHSRSSGGPEGYRELVQAALHFSASFLLVLSRASLANEWVHAEVEWVLERPRPFLLALFDDSDWETFRSELQLPPGAAVRPPSPVIDFRVDERRGAEHLAAALDALPVKYQY
jgi:hypothetical protein